MSMRYLSLALLSAASLLACSSDDSSPGNPATDAGDSGSPTGSDASLSDTGTVPGVDAGDASTSPGADAGGGPVEASTPTEAGPASDAAAAACEYPDAGGAINPVKYVFVIAMENHDAGEIIGSASAPYINGSLIPCYASSSNFNDPLPLAIPSEPHYVWMEAGTNAFSDITFTTDSDATAANSTASKLHFSNQLDAANVSWHSYQQGLDPNGSGACPINSSGDFAAKHDPYVFFQDVSGSPPMANLPYCTSHHSALTALAGDLASVSVAKFNFITPDLCHDMHGAADCPNGNTVQAGDQFLQANLPAILSFAFAHDGVVFLVWDEGDQTLKMPFLAMGPGVKRNYVGSVSYTHSSMLATNERIFGTPRLATVSAATDLADLFQPGALP